MAQSRFLFIIALCILSSCGSKKNINSSQQDNVVIHSEDYNRNALARENTRLSNTAGIKTKNAKNIAYTVATKALQFEGTPYKFGGTTKKGMDCSGLIYEAYLSENIKLPRISRDMAKKGESVKTKDVVVGDLLFFKTSRRNQINHVGLVVDVLPDQILFIHSTSSRGVIVSSLNEGYWNNAYVEARRII